MSETVDRLGVDVEVTGFSSFEDHMRRVNEILTNFADITPRLKTAGDDIAKALGKVKNALGGAGLSDQIQKDTNAAQAAINKMAAASAEALNKTVQEVKDLRREIGDLQKQNQAMAAQLAAPAGPDLTVLKANLKAQISAARNEIESVINQASGRALSMAGNQEAERVFGNLRSQISAVGNKLDELSRKRTLIDPSTIETAKKLGDQVSILGAQYQKEFDRIAKAQGSTAKSTSATAADMERSLGRVTKALEATERNIQSRGRTSRLSEVGKIEFSREAFIEIDNLRKKADELRNSNFVAPDAKAQIEGLAKSVANLNRQLNDSITIRGRQTVSTETFGKQVDNLRNRLENLRTAQTAAVRGGNLDTQQQESMIANVDQRYQELSSTLANLEKRKGMAVFREDTKAADELGRSITRLNTQLSALVTETSKANRAGLDERFQKDKRVLDDFLTATQRSRDRGMTGMAFLPAENQMILRQINETTASERARYQEILAKSAEVGAGESIKALKRLREDTIRETTAINEKMEELSLQGAVRRRQMVTQNISPEDFATGAIQRAAESSNEIISKLAKSFFYLEEAVNRSNTRWAAFFNIIDRGKAIVNAYLYPIKLLRDYLIKPVANTAAKGIEAVAVSAEKSSGAIGGLISKLGSLASAGGRAVGSGIGKAVGSLRQKGPTGSEEATVQAMSAATGSANKLGDALGRASQPANTLLGRIKAIANELYGSNNAAAQFGTTLGNALRNAMTLAAGFNISQIMINAINQIQGLAGDAFKAIGDAQAIKTQFASAIADNLVRAGDFDTLAAAEAEAAAQAQVLFDKTEKLALLSPFDQTAISNITRYLQVAGLAGQELDNLTRITVDAATGLGLTSDQAALLGKTASDVLVKMKLSGQEVLQFASAGVPIMRMISEATGKSMLELTEFFESGGIIEGIDAITLYAKVMEERFAGAAERASLTARGLANSLDDSRKKALVKFATPTFDQILGPVMKNTVDLLQSEEVMNKIAEAGQAVVEALQMVGEWAAYGFGLLKAALDEIDPRIKEVAKNFALFLASDAAFATLVAIAAPALTAIGALLAGLISWYGAYTLASAAFFTAFQNNWYGVRDIVMTVVNGVMGFFGQLLGSFQSTGDAASQTSSIWIRILKSVAGATFQQVAFIIEVWTRLELKMYNFGANIVSSLADGIAGAVNIVIESLNTIADAITYFLQPGSPPKLLPDLTKWGTGAADAYLEGWTKADFGVLGEMGESIKSAFESIGENVDVSEMQRINQALGNAMNQQMETGSFDSGELMSGLDQAVDRFDEIAEEVGRMATAQLKAAAAQRQLSAAQSELDATTQRYDDSLKSVNDEIAQLDRQLNALDSSSQEANLTSVISNRFATEKQKTAASLKLQKSAAEQKKTSLESEKTLATSVLQTKVNLLQKEVDKNNEVLGVTQERYRIEFAALNELVGLNQRVGDASSEAADRGKKATDKLGEAMLAYRMQLADTPGKIAIMREELKKYEEGSVEYYDTLTKIVQLEQQWEREKEAAAKKADKNKKLDVSGGIGDFSLGAEQAIQKVEEATGKARAQFEKWGQAITDAKTKFAEVKDTVLSYFAEGTPAYTAFTTFRDIIDRSTLPLQRLYAKLILIGDFFSAGRMNVDIKEEALNNTWRLAYNMGRLVAHIQKLPGVISGFKEEFDKSFAAAEGGPLQKFFTAINETTVTGKFSKIGKAIIDEIVRVFVPGAENGINTEAIGTSISESFGLIKNFQFGQLWTNISTAFSGLFGAGASGGESAGLDMSGLQSDIQWIIDNMSFGLDKLKQNITDGIGKLFTGAVDGALGEGTASTIVTEVQAKLDLLFGDVTFGDMTTSLTNFVTSVKDSISGIVWGDLSSSFSPLTEAVTGGLESAMGGLGDIKAGIDDVVADLQAGDIGGALSGVDAIFGGIGSTISGIINGLVVAIAESFKLIDWTTAGGGLGFLAVNLVAGILDILGKIKWGIVFSAIFGAGTSFLVGLVGGIVAGLGTINWGEKIGGVFNSLGDAVVGSLMGMVESLRDTLAFSLGVPTFLLGAKLWELLYGMINSVSERVNGAIAAINEWLPESLQLGELPVLTIDLSTDDFTVVNPQEIAAADLATIDKEDASKKITLAAQDIVNVSGEEKILIPAEELFALNPEAAKLTYAPGDVIQVDASGEKKLILDPSQVLTTKEGVFLQLDPSTIIKIDEAKPIILSAPVQISAELSAALDETLQQIQAKPTVAEADKLTAASVSSSGDGAIAIEAKPEVPPENQVTATDIIGGSETLTINVTPSLVGTDGAALDATTMGQDQIGKPLAQGVNAGYQSAIDGVQLSTDTQAALDRVKSSYGIKSPSTWTDENIGKPLGEGVMLGFGNAILAADISDKISEAMEKVKAAFGGISVGGTDGQQNAQEQAGGIAQAVVGSLTGLDEQVAAVFQRMDEAVRNIMFDMTDDLTDDTITYVEENQEALTDFYEWTADETESNRRTVTDLFSRMRTGVIAIVKDLVVKSKTEFAKIEDSFKASAKAAIDAAIKEFEDGADRMEAALEGVVGGVASRSATAFVEQGKKLGKALADGIVSVFKGADGNNFIEALASAIKSSIEGAIAEAVQNLGDTTTPQPDQPTGPRLRSATDALVALSQLGEALSRTVPIRASSGRSETTQSLFDTAAFLAPLADAGLFGTGTGRSVAAVSPLTGGSTVITTINNYNMYQTVTPDQAVRVDRNFKLFEAKNRR